MEKSQLKSHNICESLRKQQQQQKVKMHNFLVCAYNSQDFAQTEENFVQLHDHETVTFRNSVFKSSMKIYFLPKKNPMWSGITRTDIPI